MRKCRLAIGLLVAASTFTLPTLGQAEIGGRYVGIQLGAAQTASTSDFLPGLGVSSVDDGGIAARFFGGYQFAQHWAAEMGLTWYPEADATALGTEHTVSTLAVDLLAKGMYPITENLQAYGKFGPAYIKSDRSDELGGNESDLTFAYGIGINYFFSRAFDADFGWHHVRGRGNVGDADLFALGFIYSLA